MRGFDSTTGTDRHTGDKSRDLDSVCARYLWYLKSDFLVAPAMQLVLLQHENIHLQRSGTLQLLPAWDLCCVQSDVDE
jgi:hypothetical protein